MKRAAILFAVLAVAFVAVGEVGDVTQDRPDKVSRDSSSRVVFDVATRRSLRTEAEAALALWAVCSHTITRHVVDGPEPVPDGFAVTLAPALGEHSRRRLTGCLEDTTIDRVLGDVVAISSTG